MELFRPQEWGVGCIIFAVTLIGLVGSYVNRINEVLMLVVGKLEDERIVRWLKGDGG